MHLAEKILLPQPLTFGEDYPTARQILLTTPTCCMAREGAVSFAYAFYLRPCAQPHIRIAELTATFCEGCALSYRFDSKVLRVPKKD